MMHRLGLTLGLLLSALSAAPVLAQPQGGRSLAIPRMFVQPWGRFVDYWKGHAGAASLGNPITPAFLEDGHVFQYFEGGVFAYLPENPEPYRVQLQRLGWFWRARRYGCAGPFARVGEAAGKGGRYFELTGHRVPADFLAFWERTGGLALYGFPLSEAFEEKAPDGSEHLVQYFETLKLERNLEGGEVRLASLGGDELLAQGGPGGFASRVEDLAHASLPEGGKGAYPRLGHEPQYGWIAGRLSGGCPENPKMKRACTPRMIEVGLGPSSPKQVTGGAAGTQASTPSTGQPLSAAPAHPESCTEASAVRFRVVGEKGESLPPPSGDVVAFGHLRWQDGRYVYVVRRVAEPGSGKTLWPR